MLLRPPALHGDGRLRVAPNLPLAATQARMVLADSTGPAAPAPRLAERVVQDLNACPVLPWPDASFDAVLNTAAIEYLVRPAEVMAEVRRVLKPGGLFCVAFSDRWFPSKAIAVWSRLHDFERLGLVLSLFHDAAFDELHTESLRGAARPADDRYSAAREFSDPLFLVRGRKRA